ncbi:MAG: C39 family peptidase [Lachnospiraceae bacterium]|nr:C39 family peptidase [Lachnospiraceae bacterium]
MNRKVRNSMIAVCIGMILLGAVLLVEAVFGISESRQIASADYFSGNITIGSVSTSNESMQEVLAMEKQQSLLNSSEQIRYIENNRELFPEELLDLIERNVETVDFVYHYPELTRKGTDPEQTALQEKLTENEKTDPHPLLLQWDNRWGAMPYGKSMIALSGCGPTCLAMVINGLVDDLDVTPAEVARFATDNHYYLENQGTAWALMSDGCKHYGLRASEIGVDEEKMIQKLEEGCMLICSVKKGDFTDVGHFIVIYGYEDGWFEINDPNSISNSSARWKYDRLEGQIRHIWAMSEADT